MCGVKGTLPIALKTEGKTNLSNGTDKEEILR